jgi:hypothetical protein
MHRFGITGVLTTHFFRRFFDNDVLDSDGETVTTVVRAASVVAAPGLILAFFLQNSYPQRSTWGRIEDQYFFVLYSFVAMAGVAIFEWETLFPDRLDFLVLGPSPLRPRQMLLAKAAALASFLAFFLVAANGFGVVMLPLVSKDVFWHMVWAQAVATGLAGLFAVSSVIALGGLLVCILPPTLFRRTLWVLQVLATATLGLLMVTYVRVGDNMAKVLAVPGVVARWTPPLWFLGVYQELLRGASAQAFAEPASHRASLGLCAVLAAALVSYPLAWARMRRMAIQGESSRAKKPWRMWTALQRPLATTSTERAISSFIGKTMSRNSRYQVYLAMYCGVGLALAVSCAVSQVPRPDKLQLTTSRFGLHAVLPLLLFWIVAGLRTTFAVPQDLHARWLFRVAGVDPQACVQATRRWVITLGVLAILISTAVFAAFGWSSRALLAQTVYGLCFCTTLVECFFVAQRGAPFTRPRSPGKTNLPAVLTLYVGVLPPLLYGLAWLTFHAEHRPTELLFPIAVTLAVTGVLRRIRAQLIWLDEEAETADGEFQLLGLSGQLRA